VNRLCAASISAMANVPPVSSPTLAGAGPPTWTTYRMNLMFGGTITVAAHRRLRLDRCIQRFANDLMRIHDELTRNDEPRGGADLHAGDRGPTRSDSLTRKLVFWNGLSRRLTKVAG